MTLTASVVFCAISLAMSCVIFAYAVTVLSLPYDKVRRIPIPYLCTYTTVRPLFICPPLARYYISPHVCVQHPPVTGGRQRRSAGAGGASSATDRGGAGGVFDGAAGGGARGVPRAGGWLPDRGRHGACDVGPWAAAWGGGVPLSHGYGPAGATDIHARATGARAAAGVAGAAVSVCRAGAGVHAPSGCLMWGLL